MGAIERGEINPTFRILLALAHGLHLPLSEIVQVTERHAKEMRAQDRDEARIRAALLVTPVAGAGVVVLGVLGS